MTHSYVPFLFGTNFCAFTCKKKFRYFDLAAETVTGREGGHTVTDINLILAPFYSLPWRAVQRHDNFPSRC